MLREDEGITDPIRSMLIRRTLANLCYNVWARANNKF